MNQPRSKLVAVIVFLAVLITIVGRWAGWAA